MTFSSGVRVCMCRSKTQRMSPSSDFLSPTDDALDKFTLVPFRGVDSNTRIFWIYHSY